MGQACDIADQYEVRTIPVGYVAEWRQLLIEATQQQALKEPANDHR